ncbi:MAG: septum site-determining protein MinC [Pelolinea sp.]|nr:septum site-determining protein MinC [Pelolinea sp.]
MTETKTISGFPIKGFKEGLLITLDDKKWTKVQSQLLSQIDEKAQFFNGAKIAIEIGERSLRAAELARLRDELFDRGVKLFAILSNSQVTNVNAETLGFETRKSVLKDSPSAFKDAILDGEPGLFIKKTIRSGTSIKYTGNVFIDGDVNPGGEIISTGSVIIWGKLRGSVHAGVEGSEKEVVCAIELDPINLRIANCSLKENKFLRKLKNRPVRAEVIDKKISLNYWESKK